MFSTLGQRKKTDDKPEVLRTSLENINSDFREQTKEEDVRLSEAMASLLQRLKNLSKERAYLVDEVERLREESEEEAAKQEKELSILKEEVGALIEVLQEMRSRRKI